jgi:trimeric autotransporter adhesin
MAIKIQLRRGTAANWTSTNPILSDGEVGFESDTGKFKIGRSNTAWADLAYATDLPSEVSGLVSNLSNTVSSHTSATLNVHGIANTAALETTAGAQTKANAGQLAAESFATSAISTHSAVSLDVHGIANTAALETKTGAQTKANTAESNANAYTDSAISGLVDSAPSLLNTLNELSAALGDDPNFATTIANTISTKATLTIKTATQWSTDNPTLPAGEFGYISTNKRIKIGDGVTAWNDLLYVPTATEMGELLETILLHAERTTDVHGIANTAVLETISGSQAKANAAVSTSESYTDSELSAHNSDTLGVHGIANTALLLTTADLTSFQSEVDGFQSQLDLKAPLANAIFTGTIALPSTTTIGDTTGTEIGYVHGVTSAIQTQLDSKAPTANATFTGTTSGITKAMVGLGNVNNTADANKPVSTATQNALDLKANLADPTFTGTVVLPSTTSIGNVSATEIGYVDGVTSAIQAQIDSKLSSSTAASTYAPIASPTFTGTVSGVTKAMVGLGNVDNTTDANKPVSTATQTALDLKAPLANAILTGTVTLPATTSIGNVSATEIGYIDGVTSAIQAQLDAKASIASPTFTGTVSGITKAMVGLGNVDNTTDANKPISTATQTALDLKAPLANATLTGTVVLPATTSIGTTTATELGYVHGVTSAIQTQLGTKAPSESPTLANTTFTGSVTGLTKSNVGLANVDNTSDVDKPVSTATQTALDLKAPIANATFTGTLTAPAISAGDLTTANLTVTGTTTTVNSTNLAIADSIIYLADTQYAADAVDIGFYGAYGTTGGNLGNHKHTGLVRDHLDGVFKLFYNGTEPANTTVDLTTVSYADLKIGNLVASGATIGSTTNTEIGYVHGVTSAIQTQLDAKAPKESPSLANVTVTGSLTLPTGVITSAAILDGTIVNADINASAAIAATKIAGTAITAADTGTVTSTMILDGTIVNADINASAAIAATKIAGTAITAADTGTVTNTMLAGSIAPSKVTGTAITAADTGTVTSTLLASSSVIAGKIAAGTIVNADISGTAAIAVSKLAASTISGVTLGSNLNALTIGTGLTGTSYNGSAANTIAIDTAVVATLTGTQALTNKTITLTSGGITFSDGSVQTVAGVPSITTIAQKTSSYTLTSLAERDTITEIANASAQTLTVPLDTTLNFPTGTTLDLIQTGAGQITIAPATTTSTYSSGGAATATTFVIAATNSAIGIGQTVTGTGFAANTVVTNVSGTTITVSPAISSQVSGTITFATTINATPGLKLRTQWSSATLLKRSANTWLVYGDLTA